MNPKYQLPSAPNGNRLDVVAYLEAYQEKTGIALKTTKPHGDSTLYILNQCVFDSNHTDGEAAIGQCADGKLFYQCFHDSCKSDEHRKWRDARQLISSEDLLHPFMQKTAAAFTEVDAIDAQALADNLITLSDDDPAELPKPVVAKIIPTGEVTLLAGHGGAGKSYIALVIAVLVVLGRPFGGLETKACPVLFYSAEDGKVVVQHRIKKICHTLGVTVSALHGRLHILDTSDMDAFLFVEKQTPLIDELSTLVQRLSVGMIIIDNASDTFGGDEIRRVQVRTFVRSLRKLLARPNRAVILLAHMNKIAASRGSKASSEDYSGSTAWHNSCRSRLTLFADKKGKLELQHQKANHGPKADPISLTWIDGVPLANGSTGIFGDFDPERQRLLEEQEQMKDEADRSAILAVIREFHKRGERVPTAMQGSATIYHLLKACEGIPAGMTSDRFNKLVRALESKGMIIRKQMQNKYRKPCEGFVPAPIPVGESSAVTMGGMGETTS